MNKTQIAVLGVSVVAFGAAYLLFNSGQLRSHRQLSSRRRRKSKQTTCLLRRKTCPWARKSASASVTWQVWPKSAISEQMIVRSGGPHVLDDISGSMTRVSFLRGEPMRRDKLVRAGAGGFMSAILPAGMRAVAIKIDNSGNSSAGGFILPNDRVDVIRVFRDDEATRARGSEVMGTQTILTNVRVLAIGQNVQEENGKKVVAGGNATLELDPAQSELIVLAQHSGGSNLHLVLRSLVDSGGGARDRRRSSKRRERCLTIVRYGASQQAAR